MEEALLDQRTRILEAMAAETAARGAGAVTVSHVVARARVSRRTFYELFADREACLLAAFDLGVERARARMAPAYTAESRWRDGIRAGLAAFLVFLEDEPALGRLCVVHSLAGGAEVLARRAEVLSLLWEVVDRGRLEGAAGRDQPPIVIAEGAVGAVLSVIYTRLQGQDAGQGSGEEQPLIELFGALMSVILLPYLGSSAARRELSRPVPKIRADPSPALAGRDQDEGAHIRLTYRTARVLTVIAEYPGANNREVASRAGIVDQGQISKLLGRLLSLGLIANRGDGSARGAPNAWQLTELGERVEQRAAARPERGSRSLRR